MTVFGAIFLPRWRQTTSSKTSRTSWSASSVPSTASTVCAADLVTALDQLDQLVDHLARLLDVRVVAVERQLIAAQAHGALQTVAERVEHAVADPGQLGRDRVRDIEGLLHDSKCRLPPWSGKWWTLVAVCTAIFMLLLDITIVNVALPAIQRALDASFSDLQWVIDAYALALATLRPDRRVARRPVRPQAALHDRASSSSPSPRSPAALRQRRRSS